MNFEKDIIIQVIKALWETTKGVLKQDDDVGMELQWHERGDK
jgi:hypothetical protein